MSDLEEDPYISDGDSDEETINQALNNQTYTNAHDEALTPRNVDLPFDLDYVPHWTEQDVFRELYQNMKDAILFTNKLQPRDFRTEIAETNNGLEVRCFGDKLPNSKLLGYIRFNESRGTLDLVNFNSKITLPQLSKVGRSTKRGNENYAGCHGEGLKVANLVSLRHRRQISIVTNSHRINTKFKKPGKNKNSPPKPIIEIKRVNGPPKPRAPTKRNNFLASSASDDVAVTIRPLSKNGNKVTRRDVDYWFEVALDLQSAGDVIPTPGGDIILDQKLANSNFVKGLKVVIRGLEGANGKIFVNGYNFCSGRLGRDRDNMRANVLEDLITRLWADAIAQDSENNTPRYLDFFYIYKDAADISNARRLVAGDTAKVMFAFQLSQNPNSFLYPSDEDMLASVASDKEIITSELHLKPHAVPLELWKIYKKFRLVRTPQQQKTRLFSTSPTVTPPENCYTKSILRLVKACLVLDPSFPPLQIRVVQGGGTSTDTLFKAKENQILIHERWMDFNHAHEASSCELSYSSADGAELNEDTRFVCDHIVEDLMHSIYGELALAGSIKFDIIALKRQIRDHIRSMPRDVKVRQTSEAGELRVECSSNISDMVVKRCSDQVKYVVVLHKETTCSDKRTRLIAKNDDLLPNDTYECGCSARLVSIAEKQITFSDLDANIPYFAIVARYCDGAFWSTASDSGRPKAYTPAETGVEPSNTSVRQTFLTQGVKQEVKYFPPPNDDNDNATPPLANLAQSPLPAIIDHDEDVDMSDAEDHQAPFPAPIDNAQATMKREANTGALRDVAVDDELHQLGLTQAVREGQFFLDDAADDEDEPPVTNGGAQNASNSVNGARVRNVPTVMNNVPGITVRADRDQAIIVFNMRSYTQGGQRVGNVDAFLHMLKRVAGKVVRSETDRNLVLAWVPLTKLHEAVQYLADTAEYKVEIGDGEEAVRPQKKRRIGDP